MVLLQDITKEIPSTEAILRIYDKSINFNEAAVKLLGLDTSTNVVFRKGSEVSPDGKSRVYVRKRSYDAYRLHKKNGCFRVYSLHLAKTLSEMLQGKGAYRIESENYVTDYDGTRCYSIFFRRY